MDRIINSISTLINLLSGSSFTGALIPLRVLAIKKQKKASGYNHIS